MSEEQAIKCTKICMTSWAKEQMKHAEATHPFDAAFFGVRKRARRD
jgi:hypothetical protein